MESGTSKNRWQPLDDRMDTDLDFAGNPHPFSAPPRLRGNAGSEGEAGKRSCPGARGCYLLSSHPRAPVAELADALDSGSSE